MNFISAKTIYTGKKIVKDAHLLFNGKKISAVSKNQKRSLFREI